MTTSARSPRALIRRVVRGALVLLPGAALVGAMAVAAPAQAGTPAEAGPRQVQSGLTADDELRKKVVEIAQGEEGTQESDGNCNPYSDQCVEWCALFSTWVYQQAGIDVEQDAFTGNVYTAGLDKGWSHEGTDGIQPGDMVFYGTGPESPSTSTHVDIVTAIDGTTMEVIGGNVDNAVTARTKDTSELYGYMTPGE